FISWDASSATIQPEVLDWMRGQLRSEEAKSARLRILLGHLPLYAIVADKNKAGEVIADADRTLEFFREHRIDVYISGHQHAYFPHIKAACSCSTPAALAVARVRYWDTMKRRRKPMRLLRYR